MTTLPPGVLLDHEPLDAPWTAGTRRNEPAGPALHVRRIDDATYVLRQSPAVTWEAPFVFLLLGSEHALLLDTGAVEDVAVCPLRPAVDALIDEWAAAHLLGTPHLVVAHTHGHNDHTKGDAQFADRPDTTVVAKDLDAVREFFGLGDHDPTTFDLGGRELIVTSAPGHDARSVVVIDPQRRLMLTGDTAYPGRLYVEDLTALRTTLDRLVRLAEEHEVATVLGCHIERDRAGNDFPVGTNRHVDEAPLPLTVDDLRAIRDLATSTPRTKGVVEGRPMSLYFNGSTNRAMLKMAARTALLRLRGEG